LSSAYHELLKGIETRLKAGIPLRDAVAGLGRNGKGPLVALADALGSELEAGATLAEAFTSLGAPVPAGHVALIDAGESSGRLSETLAEIIEEETVLHDARRRLMMRLAYPLVICCLASLLPFLYLVFQGRTGEYLLIQACVFGPLAALILAWRYRDKVFPGGSSLRSLLEGILLRLPFVGRLVREYALAGSLQLLGRLLQAGLGFSDGLPLVSEAARLEGLSRQLTAMAVRISGGASASEGLECLEGIPSGLRSRLASGDVSGTLDRALIESGNELRESALARLEKVVKILPFLVYLLAAGLVLWQALKVFTVHLPSGF
jgi:type II secretory pathway component PulF